MHYLYLDKAKDFLVKVQQKVSCLSIFLPVLQKTILWQRRKSNPFSQAMKKLDNADLLPDIGSFPRLYHGSPATSRPGGQHRLHKA